MKELPEELTCICCRSLGAGMSTLGRQIVGMAGDTADILERDEANGFDRQGVVGRVQR